MQKNKYVFITNDFLSFERFKYDLISNLYPDNKIIIFIKKNKKNLEINKNSFENLNKIKIYYYVSIISLLKNLKKNFHDKRTKIFINFFHLGIFIALFNYFYKINNLHLFCEGRGRFFLSNGFSIGNIKFLNLIIKKILLSNFEKIIVCNLEDKVYFNSPKVLNFGSIGIDFNFYNESKKRTSKYIQIFFIGRLLKSKGALYFLKIFEKYKNYKNVKFIMVGDFDRFNQRLKKKVLKYRKYLSFKYIPYTNDLPSYFNQRSLLVFPSYYGEGSPRIIQECISLKVPVLAFESRGVTELINNFCNGLIVKNYDLNLMKFYTGKFILDPSFLKDLSYSKKNLDDIKFNTYFVKFRKEFIEKC